MIDFAVKNKAVRKLLNFGTEAAEEMIMTAVDPFFQRATVDKNAAFASLSDYGESALGGILDLLRNRTHASFRQIFRSAALLIG